jgi:methylmalonyl-CoA mutase
MNPQTPYIPKNKVRIVTAAALFDGHDAAINIRDDYPIHRWR